MPSHENALVVADKLPAFIDLGMLADTEQPVPAGLWNIALKPGNSVELSDCTTLMRSDLYWTGNTGLE